MRVTVVQLFKCGIQCDREAVKVTPATEGELVLTRRGRGLVATLKRKGSGSGAYSEIGVDALVPLIEPVLTGMNASSFVLEGIQRRTDERGDMREERQAWWCRPAPMASSPRTTTPLSATTPGAHTSGALGMEAKPAVR